MKAMKKKKTPADYPVFGFRCSPDDKAWIGKQLEILHKKFNSGDSETLYRTNKNEILMEAIRRGIQALQQVKKIRREE